jgi:hypothetical protein
MLTIRHYNDFHGKEVRSLEQRPSICSFISSRSRSDEFRIRRRWPPARLFFAACVPVRLLACVYR